MADKTPDEEYPETRRARIILRAKLNDVPLLTIITAVMVVVVVYLTGKLLYRLRDILLLMLVGGFVALLLNPMVDGLERWKIKRRGYAVAIVALGTVIIFSALAFAFGDPLVNSLTHLSHTLPSYVERAQHGKGWLGKLLRRYHVENWIHKNSGKLISVAKNLSKPALALGKGAITVLFALVTMFAFVMILLLEATKIREAIIGMLAPQHAERTRRISAAISKAALGYMLANLVISAVAAVAVFVTLEILGVPFALLFAIWVLLVDFLPTIGGALAGFPTVLFAAIHSLTAGIIMLVVFLIVMLLQNHVLYPVIMSKTVKLNPLVVFIAILVGAEVGSWISGMFGGLVGVLLAVPIAATIQVIVKEFWASSAHSTIVVAPGPGPVDAPRKRAARTRTLPKGQTEA
ncbi:MAG: AI-2E family transporter [Acidimicrobiales bacterium]